MQPVGKRAARKAKRPRPKKSHNNRFKRGRAEVKKRGNATRKSGNAACNPGKETYSLGGREGSIEERRAD